MGVAINSYAVSDEQLMERENDESGKCPECGSKKIGEDRHTEELVCKKCGLVIQEEKIDRGAEWREFSSENGKSKSRVGAPITFTKHNKGISTRIGTTTELSEVSPDRRGKFSRMKKWHSRVKGSKDRHLSFAYMELNKFVSSLNLPDSVHEEVARLYEKAYDRELIRGRKIEGVVAALVYIVSREQGAPRTMEEISEVPGLDKREVGKTYRYIARELDLRILPAKPEDYVPRFAARLDLSGKVQAKAIDLVREARDKSILSGKGPTGVAATSLYIASLVEEEKRTQKEFAEELGITEVTIRNRYKDFRDALDLNSELEERKRKGRNYGE